MGAGRKIETLIVQNGSSQPLSWNSNPHSARNLRKKDLAGVIFGCKHSTFKECIFKQLFGLPALHFKYVQNVTPGMPLFLFNYSDRTLHGIFEATSPGQMCINKYAWTLDGQEITPFPAQVRVRIRMQCQPLSEDQYKPILINNYLEHEPSHLWFELDHAQTQKLTTLFSASPANPSLSLPPIAAKWYTLFKQPATPAASQEDGFLGATNLERDPGSFCNFTGALNGKEKLGISLIQDGAEDQVKTWSSLFKQQVKKKECEDSNSEEFSNTSEDEPPIVSDTACVKESPLVIPEITSVAEVTAMLSEANFFTEKMSSETNIDLRSVVNKLIQGMTEIKTLQFKLTQKYQHLEHELEEAMNKLRKTEFCLQESGSSGSSLSDTHLEGAQSENHDLYSSILLVGGWDGSSWLQNMDCYSPFDDDIRTLASMKSVRPYSSAVSLNGEVYVLGGGYGSSWYDTVESYNLLSQQWVNYPSLNTKKGSLAGASLLGKIYSIGGGNATNCFSEVEVLDLSVGKWVFTRSMAQKRFSPAAAELKGVLYVAGGYDGHEYLSSVERYDPRACSWTRIKSMNSRRSCHSLSVLNEKLYAIGGFDGTTMVPTVEVFEPRVGSWTTGERMTFARGYMGTVTFKDKIYAICGMQENNDVLDTVECYSEGEGWKLNEYQSVTKRCFFSAVAV